MIKEASQPAEVKYKEMSLQDIQQYRDQLKKHFKDEFRIKNTIMGYEKDIENQGFSLLNKKAELNVVIKEKGQGNIQVKIINEEVDEAQTNISSLKKKLEDEYDKFNELASKRDQI